MKKAEITLVAILLLAAAGLALGYLFLGGDGNDTVEVDTSKPEVIQPDQPDQPDQSTPTIPEPTRPDVPEIKRTDALNGGLAGDGRTQKVPKQGVRGSVVDAFNNPLPGAKVFLAETFNVTNFIAALAMTQNMPNRRFNQTKTDQHGAFIIGFDPNQKADLFVVHPGHQPYRYEKVHVPTQGIEDLGLIHLKAGLQTNGYVRDALTSAPVKGATVRLIHAGQSAFQSIPGEEDGIDRRTDENGYFQFTMLAAGAYTFEAFAKGYAKDTKANTNISDTNTATQMDFSLKAGNSICGVVVDGDGNPIRGAKIDATSYSTKAPCTSNARSQKDGAFEVLGLSPGNYKLTAKAQGFVDGTNNMVKAGDQEAPIVMQRQGGVHVKVTGRNGRPLNKFFLELRSVQDGQKIFGKTQVPPVNVRNARGGKYHLTGINPGATYTLRIEADGYAMTFSEPFGIELGQTDPTVVVRLSAGGTISGRVVDSMGKPVAGARVTTMSNDYQDNPFVAMFGALIPVQHTTSRAMTNSGGEFRLRRIMPQTYQLKVEHPEYPKTYKTRLTVTDGNDLKVQDIVLPVGVVIFGKAYDPNGQPIKGGKVTLAGEKGTKFGGEASTNDKGEFQFPAAPPGTYKLSCGRVAGNNPFLQILDMKKSELVITVTGAQRRREVRVQIKP